MTFHDNNDRDRETINRGYPKENASGRASWGMIAVIALLLLGGMFYFTRDRGTNVAVDAGTNTSTSRQVQPPSTTGSSTTTPTPPASGTSGSSPAR